MRKWIIAVFIVLIVMANNAVSSPMPAECYSHTGDYNFMWWLDGIQTNSVYAIQTNKYGLRVDWPSMFGATGFDFFINYGALTEEQALYNFSGCCPWPPTSSISCLVEQNGNRYSATGWTTSEIRSSCQIVDSGKLFHRRYMRNLSFQSGCPSMDSIWTGVEIASWPDRIAFMLRGVPAVAVGNGAVEISIILPAGYTSLLSDGEGSALAAGDGSGFVLLKYPAGATMTVDAGTRRCTVRYADTSWASGEEINAGIIIYPVSANCASELSRIVAEDTSIPSVTVQQVEPPSRT